MVTLSSTLMISFDYETWKYNFFETCKCNTTMKDTNLKHANKKYFEIWKSKTNMKHAHYKCGNEKYYQIYKSNIF